MQLPPLMGSDMAKPINKMGLDTPLMIKADDSIFTELKKEAEEMMEGSGYYDQSKSTLPFTSRLKGSLSY